MKIIELLVRMNYIFIVLSAVYHSVVWMMPQYSAAELIQLRLHPFNSPSTLHLPSDMCSYHVGNTYIVGLGGVITSMAQVRYGPFGHLNHARRGGLHGLLIPAY